MKIRFFLILLAGIGAYILNSGATQGAANVLNDGYTGAPGDKTGCSITNCHADINSFGTSVTIEVMDAASGSPVTSYIPSTIYDVKVTIGTTSAPAGYGFQIICLHDQNNAQAGNWSAPGTDVRLSTSTVTGRNYAEHNKRSTTNNFTVKWQAPGFASSTGSVTFYASGNSANGNNMKSGDDPGNASFTIPEQTSGGIFENDRLAVHLSFYPNPASEFLNIDIAGELSGNYDLEIFDELGRKTTTENLALSAGDNNHQMDVCDFVPGTYTLRLHKDGKYKTARFVKL